VLKLLRSALAQVSKKKSCHDSAQTQKILNIKFSFKGMKMNSDNDTVTGWFVLNSGFKVYGRCPNCHSPRIAYHKERRPGLKGISIASTGLTPACVDCGKSLPTQLNKEKKSLVIQVNARRVP
jgi:hypothetical protein